MQNLQTLTHNTQSLTKQAKMASSSSLHYLSLTPQTLSLSKPNTTTATAFPFLSFPSSSSLKLSLSISSLSSTRPFIRNVAVSSEFDQREETEEEDNVFDSAEERSFSPDLKVFVGNLPFNVDSAALAGLFERAGNVEMVEVIYDKETGRSRGFGFVTMSTVEEVEAAAQQFNGYEFEGRALRVNAGPAPPKRERENSSFRGARGGMSSDRSNRVYVGNLSWGVDDHALETLFREQGRVMEAKVVYDRDSGRSRGFGFVTYSSAAEVNSAIQALDGVDLDGRSIRVSPAEARPRRQF